MQDRSKRYRKPATVGTMAKRAVTWLTWSVVMLAAALAGRMAAAAPAQAQVATSYIGEPMRPGPITTELEPDFDLAFSETPFSSQFEFGALDIPARPRDEYVARINRQLDVVMRSGDFVGLAVVVLDGPEIALVRTEGVTSVDTGENVSPDTSFRFASVSKGFASTLVGQLVQEGRLSWEDRVHDAIPRFQLRSGTATQSVTWEHILSQRVGLPDHAYDNFLERGESVGALLDRTARARLECMPGNCYGYQNITYSLSGDVVEQVEGRDWDEVVSERLFDPLAMRTASVGLEGLRESESWARPHTRRRRSHRWRAFEPNDNYYRVAAAGGLNGSIMDLAQWVRAQMGYMPHVLSAELREDLHSPRIETPEQVRRMRWMDTRLREAHYALGWRVFDYSGERLVFHAGGVAGYRALVGVLPERNFGFAVLWNSRTGRGWRIMPMILDAYLGYQSEDWLGVEEILAETSGVPDINAALTAGPADYLPESRILTEASGSDGR